MRFSLVTGLLEMTSEFERLLDSLVAQTYSNFEVIVVDQSETGEVAAYLTKYDQTLEIKYITSNPGVSLARNQGIKWATGDVIGFPDDDCWYPEDLLESVAAALTEGDIDGVGGVIRDEEGRLVVTAFDCREQLIDLKNVWRCASAASIFIKADLVRQTGGFDESIGLGAGTPWVSSEDVDFVIRVIKKGGVVQFRRDIVIKHPDPQKSWKNRLSRTHAYAIGMGAVMRKHGYRLPFAFYYFARALGGAVYSLLLLRFSSAGAYLVTLMGRMQGWRKGRALREAAD